MKQENNSKAKKLPEPPPKPKKLENIYKTESYCKASTKIKKKK